MNPVENTRAVPAARRIFTPEADATARTRLDALLAARNRNAYREALLALGASLGDAVAARVPKRKPFALVATPEDADFLVRGMLTSLSAENARLVCYWSDRHTFADGDVASVVRRYEDPRLDEGVATVIIAKTIISSSCIVRTNLEEFLRRMSPAQIVVAAPVMLKDADGRLKSSFSRAIARKFEFVSFATDSTVVGGEVKPGVGGMVEKRLGLSKAEATRPSLVSDWRRSLSASAGARS